METIEEIMQRLIDAGFEVWCGPSHRPADSNQKPQYFAETRGAVKDEGPEKTIWADTLREAIVKLAVYHGLIVVHHGDIICTCSTKDSFHEPACWTR
jgi:hypothetical protein